MKKLIAILLSVLCLFSVLGCQSYAALEDMFGDIIEDGFGITQEQDGIDQALSCGIHYEMQTLDFVSITYMPSDKLTFKQPVKTTVTTDTPLSVDYQFVCWKEKETGKYYYPGDEIIVTGEVVLLAVWEEKTDNYPRVIRVIINSLEMISHILGKFVGAYDAYVEYENIYGESTTVPEETTTAPAETTSPAT